MALTQVDGNLLASGGVTPTQLNTQAQYTGFKNRIINGAMMIDQRNAGASVTQISADLVFPVDRMNIYGSVTSKFTAQQNSGSVTPPLGFVNYLGCVSSSAYTVGASESFWVQQRVEGYNMADFGWGTANASTVTLSFWVRSSLTGTFGGSFMNSAADRSYAFSYTISSANTWEYKTITVAGDTTGTWLKTNGNGLQLTFSLGTGSTWSKAAGSWGAGVAYSATGATSVVGTNGATFYITGVQLEKGSTATSFDYRPYGTELALCQRYAYKFMPIQSSNNVVPATVYGLTTLLLFAVPLPVTMRATPSSTLVTNPGSGFTWLRYDGGATSTQIPTSIAFNSRVGAPNIIEVVLTAASSWGSVNNIGTLAAAGSDTGSTILSAEL